jgi:cytochrome c oxidase subunit II
MRGQSGRFNRTAAAGIAAGMLAIAIASPWCSAQLTPATMPYNDTQSALMPAGTNAGDIAALWWRTLWLLTAVYVVTLVLALIPARRRRSRYPDQPLDPIQPTPASEKRLGTVVGAGVFATTVILFILLIGDFVVGNKARALGREPDPLTIEVTGHQWWWEVRYMDPTSSLMINDADEIHVPVNRPVRFELRGADVIHSFWVPNISGKKDLIPGHPTSLTIKANHLGTYWGQCAEYCGYQHAKMRLAFIVQSPDEFSAWTSAARTNAPPPKTDLQKQGLQVFLGRTCSSCHAIQGTVSASHLGPDLTHIASRATLAAGSLPNSMGHMGGWIIDPQGIKPGVHMPQQQFSPQDLQALLEYLESLK